MIFLILTISFNLLSTGNLQELNDANNFNLPQQNLGGPVPVLADQWPVQTIQTIQGNFFGQAFRNLNSKPCSNRRNLGDSDEQWIPTFTSKIIKPIANFDNLNTQRIKENNGKNYAPLATPIEEESVPTVLDNDEHNFFKSRSALLFDDAAENIIEEPIEVLGELTPEDRSGMDITADNEDTLSLGNNDEEVNEKYNEQDTFPETMLVEPEKKLAENETENENTGDTVKYPDECMNKKKKINDDTIMGNSRRSMSKFEKQDSQLAEISGNGENELNNKNKLNKQVHMRKATPTKLLTNGKRPLQGFNNELLEPTKGSGVSELSESRMMLMDYSRLCYACSTASNPTCWAPDRKTTVKYCRKGHEACVTKTFQTGNTLTLVRDCGSSCEDVDIPGFVPKYKSCSICHSDLCNSAYTIKSHNGIFAIMLITVIKYIY